MKLHDLKAGAGRDDAAGAVVERLLGLLARGQARRAAGECLDPMQWFGRAVTRADWAGPRFAQYLADAPLAFRRIRPFPRELWTVLAEAPEVVFEGAVEADDAVYLVDLQRGAAAEVTAGVLVRGTPAGPKVARVFDPAALKRAAEAAGVDGE